MREPTSPIENTMNRIRLLTGIPVRIRVNHGRNKIEQFEGKVENLYPKIFTVRKSDGNIHTFSYADVTTKKIMFFRPPTHPTEFF